KHALLQRSSAQLLLLGLLGAIVCRREPAAGGRTGMALLGGFVIGAVPTSLWLAPLLALGAPGGDPRRGGGLAWGRSAGPSDPDGARRRGRGGGRVPLRIG